jgi:hypothetical protein
MSDQPMRLTSDDLFSARVEGYLEEQAMLRRATPDVAPQPLVLRVIYSSYFYLSVAGLIGALVAWAVIEPYYTEARLHKDSEFMIAAILMFPTVAAGVGLFLGAIEGIMCRNIKRALISSAVGVAVGFVGGLLMLIPVGILFSIGTQIARQVNGPMQPGQHLRGMALMILIIARSVAWALAAIPAGLGQGIALREKKVVLNGVLGAMLGGLLGGVFFDPIYLLLSNPQTATLSRAVGFGVIGVMVGLFVGLVEQWTKTAWLLMKAGALAGKQFVLYRDPTVIGSSPKADIYIFKDDAIEPRHALIHNRGGRFELEDCNTPDGTYVNGIPIKRHILQNGDQLVMGKTMLEFSLKESA